MIALPFNKYQGAGNDFVIIDNRYAVFNPDNHAVISRMCNRRFGIGADGLILVNKYEGLDFEMVYFNSDGYVGSMCGNGGRCTADFAIRHGIAGSHMRFKAYDGIHEAFSENGKIRLQMSDINDFRLVNGNYFINTGSPHYVLFKTGIESLDVYNEGKKIRQSDDFKPGGTNVNFVEAEKNGIYVRTFERGVEEETLSCGTGVTASAIASVISGQFVSSPVNVRTRGGDLRVEFDVKGKQITNVWLSGPATFVFEGTYII
jgi:diaminopimelate epimerase